MKWNQVIRMALGLIAIAGLATNYAAAQGLSGVAGKVTGSSAVNNQIQQQVQGQVQQQVQAQVQSQLHEQIQGQLQSQVQEQVQQRVQGQLQSRLEGQVQQQLQAQVQQQLQARVQGNLSSQAQLRADAARAGVMAQQAINNARQQAVGNVRLIGEGNITARANANLTGENIITARAVANQNITPIKGKPLGALTPRADRIDNSSNRNAGKTPLGFAETDIKIYDAVFGSFNPFRGSVDQDSETKSNVQADAATDNQIATKWQSSQGVVKTSANAELDLATRIDSAVHQRRAEISVMRDQAMEASNEAMMEQAEQMEQVLDLFIEARAQAAVNASDRRSTTGPRKRGLPVDRNPNSTRINAEQNSQIQGTTGTTGGNDGR